MKAVVGAAVLGAGAEHAAACAVLPAATSVADVVALLRSVPLASDGAGLIDQLRGLEDLKSLAAARQAGIAVAFDLSQRREQAAAGVPVAEQGTGVAAQIALARRESPAKGSRLLGLAKTLAGMPRTFAAFRDGRLNEWRVTLIVKETICLTPEDRAGVMRNSPRTPAPWTVWETRPSRPRSGPRRTGATPPQPPAGRAVPCRSGA